MTRFGRSGRREDGVVHAVQAVILAGVVFACLRWFEDGQARAGLLAGTAFGIVVQSTRALLRRTLAPTLVQPSCPDEERVDASSVTATSVSSLALPDPG